MGDTTIGPYRLTGKLGTGGYGVVYRARDTRPEGFGEVAVKLVSPPEGGRLSREAVSRFQQEARILAAVRHANVVRYFDHGTEALTGRHYIVMEYVPGGSLDALLKSAGVLPARQAVEVALGVTAGVGCAHAGGVLHRDVKPANVLLHGGTPRVADFGIARLLPQSALGGQRHRTVTGTPYGTPGYMAPEQVEGIRELGPEADVHGIGAVLYHLLTGRPPFAGATVNDVWTETVKSHAVPPRRVNPRNVDTALDRVVCKCLNKDPADRYRTARELEDELRRWLDRKPVSAKRLPPWKRLRHVVRHKPAVVKLSLSLGLVSLAALALSPLAVYFRSTAADATSRLGETATALTDATQKLGETSAALTGTARLADQAKLDAKQAELRKYAAQYVVDLQNVNKNWSRLTVTQARDALDRHDPGKAPVPVDLRGFEWYYWSRLCAAGQARGTPPKLMRHGRAVSAVAFSPDGARLYSAGDDGTARAWDVATADEVARFVGHRGPVASLAVDPGGRSIATGGEDGTARVWDAATAEERYSVRHDDPVRWVAYNGTGDRLVTVAAHPWKGGDTFVRDAATGVKKSRLGGDRRAAPFDKSAPGCDVASAKFHPTADQLVVLDGGYVCVWNDADRPTLRAGRRDLPGFGGAGFAITPDGRHIIAGDRGLVRVLDAPTGPLPRPKADPKRVPSAGLLVPPPLAPAPPAVPKLTQPRYFPSPGAVGDLAVSADGRRLAGACGNDVLVWSLGDDRLSHRLKGHQAPVASVAFSPDGRRVASGGRDGAVRVWPIEDGPGGSGPASRYDALRVTPAGLRLGRWEGVTRYRVEESDATSLRQGEPVTWEGNCDHMTLSPDGTRLAVITNAPPDRHGVVNHLQVFDAESGKVLTKIPGVAASFTSRVTFSPDNRLVAAVVDESDRLPPRKPVNGKSVAVRRPRRPVLKVWDLRSGSATPLAEWPQAGPREADPRPTRGVLDSDSPAAGPNVTFVYFSGDGERVTLAAEETPDREDGAVVLRTYSTSTGQHVASRRADFARGLFAAGPDGRWLLTKRLDPGQESTAVRCWDGASGAERFGVVIPAAGVSAVAMNPDGSRLAVAAADKTVTLWDCGTGRELLSLPTVSTVQQLGFAPDGCTLWGLDDLVASPRVRHDSRLEGSVVTWSAPRQTPER